MELKTEKTTLMQRLSILHMTLQEVEALASEQLEENPMLDTLENCGGDTAFSDVSLDAMISQQNDAADNISEEEIPKIRAGQEECPEETAESFFDFALKPETLADYLELQLVDYPLDEGQKQLCRYLIDSLDERGFLTENIEEIAARESVDPFELTQMLYVLQSLDPPGIGARDLQECLILQLAAGDRFNGHTVRIVKEGMDLLSRNKIPAIAKLLGVSTAEAERCCDAVRSLSPIPSRGYHTGEDSGYIVPDAIIQTQGQELVVQMNDSMIPHLIINPEYEDMIASSEDPALREYLKKHLAAAEELIGDIAARRDMLCRLLVEIAERQKPFFRDGKSLQPMRMADLAEALGVHTSTVSRGIRGKYVACAAGVVSLRSLFTSGYQTDEKAVSAVVIKRKLLELIAAEDRSAPLSDEALCQKFHEMNIELSRRTVAKYREEQGIPSSHCRKEGWQ